MVVFFTHINVKEGKELHIRRRGLRNIESIVKSNSSKFQTNAESFCVDERKDHIRAGKGQLSKLLY